VKWSRFESVGDLLVEIDNYKARIYQHDASVFTDIHYEFAEAGSFRKIAMLNYWDRSFFKLAKRYDLLFAAVKLKAPTPIEAHL
jgi:hypothetical protein